MKTKNVSTAIVDGPNVMAIMAFLFLEDILKDACDIQNCKFRLLDGDENGHDIRVQTITAVEKDGKHPGQWIIKGALFGCTLEDVFGNNLFLEDHREFFLPRYRSNPNFFAEQPGDFIAIFNFKSRKGGITIKFVYEDEQEHLEPEETTVVSPQKSAGPSIGMRQQLG